MIRKTNKKQQYAVRSGGRVAGDIQLIGEEMERVRHEHDGNLTADDVVTEATKESSPLHGEFIWDDKKAAREHRLDSARRLIRLVIVVDSSGVHHQQYVHVPVRKEADSRSGYYKPMVEVVTDIDEFQAALSELNSKLTAATRAVEEFREVAGKPRRELWRWLTLP